MRVRHRIVAQITKTPNRMNLSRASQLVTLACLLICSHGALAKLSSFKSEVDSHEYQAQEVVGKTPRQLLELRGFLAKEYSVRTGDGHSIQVVRIIHPFNEFSGLKRPVVFNHGLFESATIWLINSRNVGPVAGINQCNKNPFNESSPFESQFLSGPMMLANHGYDVWLMSMRGTDYSQGHDYLSPNDPEFWNYCLDDFGLEEVPSVVNFVRKETGARKVAYVGHSQATFSIFALLSTHPEYADVIEPVFAVAPVAYMHHTTSLARQLFLGTLLATKNTQHGPFPSDAKTIRSLAYKTCDNRRRSGSKRILCELIQELISGKGEKWLAGYYAHLPYYTSLKVLRHFGQLIKFKRFGMYDYGPDENIKVYGSSESPSYPIEAIKSKSLVLISTRSDALSPPADVDLFKTRLSVPIYRDIYINENFNHFDLITDKQAGPLVFGPILEILEDHEHRSGVCSSTASVHPEQSDIEPVEDLPQPVQEYVDYHASD